MTGENNDPESRKEARKVWMWTRATSSTETPSDSSTTSTSTPSEASPQEDPRLDTSRTPPKDLPHLSGKLDPKAFQSNFPQQTGGAGQHATVSDAIKTIKPEDFLSVTSTPCARDGLLGGIGTGALFGGYKFVMSSTFPKVANWAVGGMLLGATLSFEYCQWKRRQEKVQMKRAVVVYQETLAEKRRKEYEAMVAEKDEADRLKTEAEAQRKKTWYKFW